MSEAAVPVAKPLLEVRQLAKSFGALRATDKVDLSVTAGETHAIIGPNGAGNGAGKTTLIGQLSGNLLPDEGTVTFSGEDITRLPAHARTRRGLSRSFQITSIYRDFTALENVALAVQAHAGHSFRFWRPARGDASLVDPALQILKKIGLEGRKDILAAELAHGEQRQLEIAMALASEPRVLLLDEPVAGMGIEESQRMIGFLAGLKGTTTMILVEHDMDAVFTLADRISVLVYGRIIATGAPADIRANREVQRAYLGEDA
jgi:branched-chain amino acid transport system ATP-binding protein